MPKIIRKKEVSMGCGECSCWKISDFSYPELCKKWSELVGGLITPGYRKRFEKEGARLGVPVDEVVLSFKYCLKGKLSRFYIVKYPGDTKPAKKVTDCPGFTTSSIGVLEIDIPSPLWSMCMKECHGSSMEKGQLFYPGLLEQQCYSRIPAHGTVKPQLILEGLCDICGKEFSNGIMIKEVTRFCCNRHYLQWWKDHNPKTYEKLNR